MYVCWNNICSHVHSTCTQNGRRYLVPLSLLTLHSDRHRKCIMCIDSETHFLVCPHFVMEAFIFIVMLHFSAPPDVTLIKHICMLKCLIICTYNGLPIVIILLLLNLLWTKLSTATYLYVRIHIYTCIHLYIRIRIPICVHSIWCMVHMYVYRVSTVIATTALVTFCTHPHITVPAYLHIRTYVRLYLHECSPPLLPLLGL